MNNNEINLAIAEECGWQIHPKDRFIVIPPNSPHSVQPLSTIPSYATDLNAMHSAEKVLTPLGRAEYAIALADITNRRGVELDYVGATARQRAEAFLRTLGKWKE